MMDFRQGRGERVMVGTVLALLVLGSLTVFSSSSALSTSYLGSSTAMFLQHLAKVATGLLLLLVLSRLDYRLLRRLAKPLLIAAVVSLSFTFVPDFPLAVTRKGATRWLDVGVAVVQPAEFVKLALVIYIASVLAAGESQIRDYWRGFVPVLSVLGIVSLFLASQPNYGSALTLGLLTGMMLFVGGARLAHLGVSGLGTLGALGLAALSSPHVKTRLGVFLDPGHDPLGAGFQLHQAEVALGSGGLLGLGLGAGRQCDFLPECHTDFVFAVLGEEFGLLGTMLVVALYGLFLLRGVAVARQASDSFGRHLAVGITGMIGIVAFLNIAVVLGLAPTTGLPLPFLSYGGSSMLVNLAGVGILLSIASRSAGRRRRVLG